MNKLTEAEKEPLILGLNKERIRMEQTGVLCRQIVGSIICAPVGAILLIILQHEYVAHSVWLPWLLAVVVINSGIGWVVFRYYKRYEHQVDKVDTMSRAMFGYAIPVGVVWGLAGVLFFPAESIQHQLITYIWLWTLVAMLAAAMVSSLNLFRITGGLVVLPLTINSALIGDQFHMVMAGTTIVIFTALSFFHTLNYRTFVDALSLRFENHDLVEQLHQKRVVAEKANSAKSLFLAAASHDLRQPVHAQGMLIAALDEYVDNPRGRKLLGGLESSIEALRALLEAVLDMAKLDAAVIEPHPEDFSINRLFEDLRTEFLPQCQDKDIELHIAKTSAILYTDPVLLGRILRNIVSNALKYTEKGRILIGARRKQQEIQIEVWDTGIGIEIQKQEKIFDEFYQVENQERDREKGIGLGLSIVKRISRLLNLSATVRSVPGKGTRFMVTAPTGMGIPERETVVANSACLEGLGVILIEDNRQVMEATRALLESWGCAVLCGDDAGEAIDQLSGWQHHPDIIIADYRLRDGEGTRAIKKLRATLMMDLPAIVVTGDTAPDRIRDAVLCGDPVLHKPLKPEKLRASIATLCGRT